jgi:hypothetical protein
MNKDEFNLKPSNHFILLVLLALVIVVESISIVSNLTNKQRLARSSAVIPKNIFAPEAKKGTMGITLNQGQTVVSSQNLKGQIVFDSSSEPLAGIDVILTFDPKLITILDISPNKDLFDQALVNLQQKDKGRIKITAYQPKKNIVGKLVLANISFRLLENQPAVIGIEFLGPDRVTDSNLVSKTTQKDILSSVQSLKLTPEK